MAATSQLRIPFPRKGFSESQALSNQPEGTTASCVNVVGFEPVSGRNRGGSRAGASRYCSVQMYGGLLGGTQDIDHVVGVTEPTNMVMESDSTNIVMEDGSTLMDMEVASSSNIGQRLTTVVGVCGGGVHVITSTAATLVTSGSNALSPAAAVIYSQPFIFDDTVSGNTGSDLFFCDGTNYKYLDISANSIVNWTATAGTLPADDSGNRATLIGVWHNRLILTGVIGDAANWYMSEVGNSFGWNYSPTSLTETMAVAGNEGSCGKMGDIITGLIPYTDDVLLLCGANSLERITGDPAAGGRRDMISDITGVAWGRAWAKAPDGTVYFMGSRGGVYRIQPTVYGAIPQRLTAGVIDERLADINLDDYLVTLEWDDAAIGVKVFVSPRTRGPTTHYFYDLRNEAWWPYVFKRDYHNPLCVHLLSGYATADRRILYGTRDGYILQVDHDAGMDDGIAIESSVWIGPLPETMILELQAILSDTSEDVTWTIHSANTLESALTVAASATGRFTKGRNRSQWPRSYIKRGYIQLSSTKPWALEELTATIEKVSAQRARIW